MEPTINEFRSVYAKKAAIFLLSAAFHIAGFYVILHSRINYRIYKYDKAGLATVLLLPKDGMPLSKAPKSGAPAFQGPEPLIVKPGKALPAGAAAEAKPPVEPKAAPAEPAAGAAAKPGAPAGPPGGRPGGEAGPPSPGSPSSGAPAAGFSLTYPLGSQLKLTKPGDTPIDEILRPEHYRTRTDINFATYLRPDPAAKAPSGRIGTGRGGAGGGGPGSPGRGAIVTMDVARYDLAGWASGVLARIQKNWTLESPEDSGYRVEVRIAVMMARNGDLLAVEIEAPSNVEALDRAAARALRASGPFPALPADFPKSSLDMIFVFQYGY